MKNNCKVNTSLSLIEAVEFREKIRAEGKRFVLTNGCFDLIHAGHVYSLNESRKLGDCLWVAINSDKSIAKLKGDHRPILSETDRAYMLNNLNSVSGVTIFNSLRLVNEINELKPDIYVKSGDYNLSNLDKEEHKALIGINAKIHFVPFLNGYSTSSIVEKIKREI